MLHMKKKNVIKSASARRLGFSVSRACLYALTALLVVFATGLLPVSAQNDATNRPPIQTFYLPIPEEDLLQTLTSIHGGASWTLPAEPVESYNSIDVFVDGTNIKKLNGLDTPVAAGDTVMIVPAIAGGC